MQVSSESSSSTSSYTNYSYSSSGMSGLISGMDTENLVKSMLSDVQSKIDSQNQQKQQLTWKQDMYRDVITDINSFQSKYLDLTASTSLRSNSFFNSMTTSSSSSAVKINGASSSDAQNFSVQVAQLATASKITSGKYSSGSISMDLNSISDNISSYFTTPKQEITFTVGGEDVSVDLCSDECKENGSPSLNKMIETINNKLSSKGVTLSADDNNKITVKSTNSDSSDIAISGSSNALATLGLKKMTLNSDNDYSYTSTTAANASTLSNKASDSASIVVSLDGSSKTIKLTNGTSDEIISSFKSQLKSNFGTSITVSDDGKISAREGQTLSISGDTSVLGIESGACTRLSTSSTLSDIGISDYNFSINGTNFEFNADTKVSEVMSKINSSSVGSKLVYNSLSDSFSLTSNSTGEGFELNISGGIADSFFKTSTFTSGKNAIVNINGNTVERTSNNFSYNGVSMTLKATTGNYFSDVKDSDGNVTGTTITKNSDGTFATSDNSTDSAASISADRDVSKITDTIKSFVTDYNTLIEKLNGLTHASKTYNDYKPLTDAQKKEMSETEIAAWEKKSKEGLLSDDSDINNFLSSMRTKIYSLTSDGTSLSMFGIDSSSNWKDYGKLEIDEDKLKENLSDNPSAVISTFISVANGLNTSCKETANSSSASPGTLVSMAGIKGKVSEKNNTIKSRLDNIAEKITSLQDVYDTRKQRYWSSFNSMETAIANISSTSSYLTQTLGG